MAQSEEAMKCRHDHCQRESSRDGECYAHYLKGVNFNYGHLRNRLYPGEPIKSTEKIVRAEARAKGEDAVPADWT